MDSIEPETRASPRVPDATLDHARSRPLCFVLRKRKIKGKRNRSRMRCFPSHRISKSTEINHPETEREKVNARFSHFLRARFIFLARFPARKWGNARDGFKSVAGARVGERSRDAPTGAKRVETLSRVEYNAYPPPRGQRRA